MCIYECGEEGELSLIKKKIITARVASEYEHGTNA